MGTVTQPEPPVTSPLRNLPNQLTAARFVLAVVLFVLIAFELWPACLAVFLLAAITDWLDGYLARKYNLGSAFGRNFDPLADKVLTCGAFIFLLPWGAREGWLVPWMVCVVVLRELIITGLRSFLEGSGAKFGADWLGKIKMWLQCAALIVIFLVPMFPEESTASAICSDLRSGLIYAMVGATALSGGQYLWRAAVILGVKP
jgi:CDP-diacylglycerol---glycerol-3-phosphate 3-phosphatidyltransferase